MIYKHVYDHTFNKIKAYMYSLDIIKLTLLLINPARQDNKTGTIYVELTSDYTIKESSYNQ